MSNISIFLGTANSHTFAATDQDPEKKVYNIRLHSDELDKIINDVKSSNENEQFIKAYMLNTEKEGKYSICIYPERISETKFIIDLNIDKLKDPNIVINEDTSIYLTAAESNKIKDKLSIYQHKKGERNTYVGYAQEPKQLKIVGSAFLNKSKSEKGFDYTTLVIDPHKFSEEKKNLKNELFLNCYVNVFNSKTGNKPLYVTVGNEPSKNAEFSALLNGKGISFIENNPDKSARIFLSPRNEKSISQESSYSDLNVFIKETNKEAQYLGSGWTKEQLNKDFVFEAVKNLIEGKNKEKEKTQKFGYGDIVSFQIDETYMKDKYIDAAIDNGLLPDKIMYGTITGNDKNLFIITTPVGNLSVDIEKNPISKSTPNELREFTNVYSSVKKELDGNLNKDNTEKKSADLKLSHKDLKISPN